jgi:hypothetical protein
MRSILLIAGLAVSLTASAQKKTEPAATPSLPVNKETGLIAYEGVMDITGASKDGLYSRAIGWAQGYYKNPVDVMREKDPVNGKLVCKARFKLYNAADKKGTITEAGDVMYTLTIQFKDGKYKYEMTNFNWMLLSVYPAERWKDTASATYKQEYAYYLQQIDDKAKEVLLALKKAMTTAPEKKKDDW